MLSHTHSLGWLGECYRLMSVVVLSLLSLTPVCLSAETVLPVLTTDTNLATAGYYQVSWQPGVAGVSSKSDTFELQLSSESSFNTARTIYRGPDRARVISGQPDGEYFYRIRLLNSNQASTDWSSPITVRVQHHSLQNAWWFFTAGAGAFFMILFFIVTAAHKGDEVR